MKKGKRRAASSSGKGGGGGGNSGPQRSSRRLNQKRTTYARNFNGEGYDREASQRGVIVHRVDGYGTMKTHYLFVLFDRGAAVPALDAEYRRRFNTVRHLVSDLWEKDDE